MVASHTPNPLLRRAGVSLLVWIITFDLSGMGDPISSYATAGIALRIIWPLKPSHCFKVETPSGGKYYYYYYYYVWPVWLYHVFPHYLINGTIFEGKLWNTKCVFWFSVQLLSEKFLIVWGTGRYITINVHSAPCKVPAMLVSFQYSLNILDKMSKKKNTEISIFVKIRSVGAELLHVVGWRDRRTDGRRDRRTDMTKLTVTFRNFFRTLLKTDVLLSLECYLSNTIVLVNWRKKWTNIPGVQRERNAWELPLWRKQAVFSVRYEGNTYI